MKIFSTIINWFNNNYHFHSWKENCKESYRWCEKCGAIQSFLYNSQGGSYVSFSEHEKERFENIKNYLLNNNLIK